MTAVAVIVAAGKGERFGDASKVLVSILDRPALAHTLDAFEQASSISEIVVVVGEHTQAAIAELVFAGGWRKASSVVPGGRTRQESTAHGVSTVPAGADVIVVHDAARPLVTPEQIDACVEAAYAHGGAIVAAPITDTVKRVEAGEIVATLDRSVLWGAQTPQAFRADLMHRMIALGNESDTVFTDEASLAEALGIPVRIVAGDSTNLKITHPVDVALAELILRTRKDVSR